MMQDKLPMQYDNYNSQVQYFSSISGGECSHWHSIEKEIHYYWQAIHLNNLCMYGNNLQ